MTQAPTAPTADTLSEAVASAFTTLRDVLDACRSERPDAVAYAFIRDDLSLADSLTRGELATQAAEWAEIIEQQTVEGDRVVLLYTAGLDFVRAFWACVQCGRIAVPVYAPDPMRFKHNAPHLRAVLEDAQASLVLSTAGLLQLAEADDDLRSEKTRWLALEHGNAASQPHPASSVRERKLGFVGNSIAYLQYTSGSTGTPRGAMITHANVLAQCASLKLTRPDKTAIRFCLWLPHYHDYGLVIGVLLPPSIGATSYLMSPLTFLRRPLCWLRAVDRFRITHTGAPNFGYAACVRALEKQGWQGSLDCLENASCGAEPIRPEVGRRFTEMFAPFGLRNDSFTPAYGMAETVLDISIKPAGRVALVLAFDATHLSNGKCAVSLPIPRDGGNWSGAAKCCLDSRCASSIPTPAFRAPPTGSAKSGCAAIASASAIGADRNVRQACSTRIWPMAKGLSCAQATWAIFVRASCSSRAV